MYYFAGAILYSAAMRLVYGLFLKNRPLHALSRAYLLSAAVLSMVLPFIRLDVAADVIRRAAVIKETLPEYTVNATGDIYRTFSYPAAFMIYATVCVILLVVLLVKLLTLKKLIKASNLSDQGRYSLVTGCGYGPGSFGRYILFPGAEVNEHILAHEQAHVIRRHSLDILFISVLQAIAWPNIVLVWIRKELTQVHEFEADAHVVADRNEYGRLLLNAVFHSRSVSVMHLFIIHPIKRRIMMLQKKGKASLSKALFQVAVSSAIIIVAGIVIQSCGKRTNDGAGASLREAEYIAQDSIRKTADVMPAFKGGSGEMYKFLSKELRYPQYARDNKIEGRVLVKFIVSPKGRIIDAEVVRSPDSSLSREALAVVKGMPDWEPAHMNDGRTVPVEFVLPVAFKLN